jgi:hypothetical protein
VHERLATSMAVDINECENEEMQACPGTNSECVNTLGSFQCQCLTGFAEINGSCLGKCISLELY